MISIEIKTFRISLTFGFFFVLALTTLRDNSLGTMSLLFCIVHEFGHLAVMRLFGVNIHSLRFYGAGIKITADPMDALPKPATALIYLAGVMTNLALAALLHGDLRTLNLSLAAFNILPITYFDGGKLLELFFPRHRFILTFLSAISYVSLAFLIALTAYHNPHTLNPSAIMTFIFIAISCILDV